MVLQETRPICADREARNVATKHNFNMQTCGCQEKSRWTAAGFSWADTTATVVFHTFTYSFFVILIWSKLTRGLWLVSYSHIHRTILHSCNSCAHNTSYLVLFQPQYRFRQKSTIHPNDWPLVACFPLHLSGSSKKCVQLLEIVVCAAGCWCPTHHILTVPTVFPPTQTLRTRAFLFCRLVSCLCSPY